MTDDDPIPLKAGGEATPELVRALYALGRRDPDVARLARVAEKLGAALADLPPPGSSNGFPRLIGTKTLITGIVIGIAALSWLGYHSARRGVAGPANAPPPPAATESSQSDETPNQPIEVASSRDSTDHFTNTVLPATAGPSDGPGASVATSRRSLRRSGPAQPAAAAPSQSPRPTVSSAPASEATPAIALAVPSAPVAALEESPPMADQLYRAAQPSEVELLFDARRAIPSQPAAALRLLDEHAARFPNGMLGPERDVLTIEALRKLGRTAEAAKRLRQFESRYPKSIHLHRLQADTAAP